MSRSGVQGGARACGSAGVVRPRRRRVRIRRRPQQSVAFTSVHVTIAVVTRNLGRIVHGVSTAGCVTSSSGTTGPSSMLPRGVLCGRCGWRRDLLLSAASGGWVAHFAPSSGRSGRRRRAKDARSGVLARPRVTPSGRDSRLAREPCEQRLPRASGKASSSCSGGCPKNFRFLPDARARWYNTRNNMNAATSADFSDDLGTRCSARFQEVSWTPTFRTKNTFWIREVPRAFEGPRFSYNRRCLCFW
jgi:hypothetical protein